jgi:hypothetical protein
MKASMNFVSTLPLVGTIIRPRPSGAPREAVTVRSTARPASGRPSGRTALLFLAFVTPLAAQQTNAVVGSTVSGHVLCDDTNTPARFAKILLKSTAPDHTGEDFMKNIQDNIAKMAAKSGDSTPIKPPTPEQKKIQAAAARNMNQVTDMLNSSTVGLDGSYSFAGVKPGTYYVHAIFAGYIDPFSQFTDDDFASTDPAMRARIAQIPTITVNGAASAKLDLRLQRGAAVSGRVLFDDGSPAAGWTMSVIAPGSPDDPADATNAAMSAALAMGGVAQVFKTDDLGRYRISGLPAGPVAVRASLIATPVGISASNLGDGGSGINLAVYTGDTFTRTAAKAVNLTAGEEHSGTDITIPAHTLHNITGHVYAKSDGHPLNVGSVELTAKQNPALHLKAAIRDDGSFHFEYLPSGTTYTVTVQDAADGVHKPSKSSFMGISMPDTEILRKYGTDTADVQLADSDVDSIHLDVALTDWKPSPKKPGDDMTPGDLLNMLSGPPPKP